MSLHHRQKNHKIDRIAIEYFLRKVIFHKRFSPEAINYTTEEVKQNLQLINDEGKLKNAALLLFGKDPQRHFVSAIFRIGRFGGENNDLLFQDTIEGNILQMGDKVVEVLKNKYLISLIHYEGMVRVKTLEIPAIFFYFLNKIGSNSCMSKKMIIFTTWIGNIPQRHFGKESVMLILVS